MAKTTIKIDGEIVAEFERLNKVYVRTSVGEAAEITPDEGNFNINLVTEVRTGFNTHLEDVEEDKRNERRKANSAAPKKKSGSSKKTEKTVNEDSGFSLGEDS